LVSTNFAQTYKTAPGGVSRKYQDRLGEVVNVKDFGAVGDGSHADAAAIQAAIDYAYGVYPNTRFLLNKIYNNRPVYIPAGTYMVDTTLILKGIHGALIFGDGPNATVLKWNGAKPGGTIQCDGVGSGAGSILTGSMTHMFLTNGFGHSTLRDFGIDMGSISDSDGTVCFNWNWDNSVAANTSHLVIENMRFANSNYGWLSGASHPYGGYECDTVTFLSPVFENCSRAGFAAFTQNAIGHSIYGGAVRNCALGLGGGGGCGLTVVTGLRFSGNTWDIGLPSGCCLIAGCNSTSLNFVNAGYGPVEIVSCRHEPSSPGYFLSFGTTHIQVDNCYGGSNSYLGAGGVSSFLRVANSTFMAANPIDGRGVGLSYPLNCDLVDWRMPSGYLASLVSWPKIGMTQIITDAKTNVFGADVTVGAGSFNVLARYNGSIWTVMGA
jgi:pectate lyase-like protein